MTALVVGSVAVAVACGAEPQGSSFVEPTPTTTSDASAVPNFPTDAEPACTGGIACKQVDCGAGSTTTLSGTVTAPNGTLPLYNVIVYIPQAPLDPMPEGRTCDRCGTVSGKPLVSTLTNVEGKFTLSNVPVGEDIPLVIQVGKWRRQVTIPKVDRCVDNPITDINLTRLPRNRGEGDIPKIAVTTGRCDQLACLLPKLGLDASEFTPNTGPGRLHLYRGATHGSADAPAPTGTPDSTDLYDATKLATYDMVLLSCECGEHNETKPSSTKKALYEYTSLGGRVFASHFHYTWADTGPLSTAAQWMGDPSNPENPPGPYLVDRSFAKGDALAQWLVNVKASTTLGEIPISQPRENVGKVIAPTQRWVYRNTGTTQVPQSTKYLSINAPVGKPVAEQCGKFVFADMHLWAGDVQPADSTALPNDAFPASCGTELTPEERALAFLFFDLSSCVQDDGQIPVPPVN